MTLPGRGRPTLDSRARLDAAGATPQPEDAMSADPLAHHRASAGAALAGGDPDTIKRLYIQLGGDWLDAHGDGADLESIPVLSAPETTPVVVGRLRSVSGLILDAGCGPNPAVSLALAAGGNERVMVSLDIGWGTVRIARQIARQRGVDLVGVVGDVERLPFRSGRFDGVACVDCVEHLPDDVAGVTELARVARPKATVVVATPNRGNARILRRRVGDRLRGARRPASHYYVSNSHIREYTWGEFERLISPALRLRERAPVGWTGGWKSRLATRLLGIRPLHRLSQMIVVDSAPR